MNTTDSSAIQWSKNLREKSLLSSHLIEEFERYFKGEYIRSQNLSTDLTHINDFLKILNKQELDIFLKLKANYAKGYTNKTFTEILIHCIEKTGPMAKKPLLFALDYILSKNEPSKDTVIENIELIENIANSENTNINGIAQSIIQKLDESYRPKTESQYVFDHKEEYEFYRQLREIIKRAKSSIKFWDNYANHEIIDYIHAYVDKENLKNVKIIFKKQHNETDLKLAQNKFSEQHPKINLEIKKSTNSHDRFLIIDKEIWGLGPSIKDGGKEACFISQLKDEAATKLENIFDTNWSKASSI